MGGRPQAALAARPISVSPRSRCEWSSRTGVWYRRSTGGAAYIQPAVLASRRGEVQSSDRHAGQGGGSPNTDRKDDAAREEVATWSSNCRLLGALRHRPLDLDQSLLPELLVNSWCRRRPSGGVSVLLALGGPVPMPRDTPHGPLCCGGLSQ
jgi:hypothetical protein